jgi:hypothetical protein
MASVDKCFMSLNSYDDGEKRSRNEARTKSGRAAPNLNVARPLFPAYQQAS